jgi:hypothetical protein
VYIPCNYPVLVPGLCPVPHLIGALVLLVVSQNHQFVGDIFVVLQMVASLCWHTAGAILQNLAENCCLCGSNHPIASSHADFRGSGGSSEGA